MAQRRKSAEMSKSSSPDDFQSSAAVEGIGNLNIADTTTIRPVLEFARPTHFLPRGDRFTPLIALDEIPPQFKVSDLPLYWSIEEVRELGAIPVLDKFKKAKNSYYVEIFDDDDDIAPTATTTESTQSTNQGATMVPSNATLNDRLARCFEGGGTAPDPEKLRQSILNLKNQQRHANAKQSYNPTTPGVLGEKVYCTHWMRTGECDFTQQGCMFLHYMPDLPTLELLGFRSYPRWFREMPRLYQEENSKDFSEEGLSGGRGQVPVDRGRDHWHKGNGNKYIPSRNQSKTSIPPGISQPPPFAAFDPGHNNNNQFLPTPGSWMREPNFNSPTGPTHTPQQFAAGPYQSAPLQSYPPQHQNRDVWSMASSPTMDFINQAHKPLTPQIRGHPNAYGQAIIGTPFSQFHTPVSRYSQAASAIAGPRPAMPNFGPPSNMPSFNNGPAPRRNNRARDGLFNVNNGRGGRGGNRGGRKGSPKAKNKNPYGVLAVERSAQDKDGEFGSDQTKGQKK